MATDFKKQLLASKKTWKAAQTKVKENRGKSGAPEFEDGIYLARLTAADLGEWNGTLKTLFKWKFLDGPYDGQVIHDYQGMGSEDNMFYFGKRIEDFGYEMPDDPTEIPEILTAIVADKQPCKIRLKTGGAGYQNVYLQKLVNADDDDDAVEETDDAEETEAEAPTAKPAKGKAAGKKAATPPPAEEEEEEEEAAEEEDADEEEVEEEETEDGDVELSVGMAVIATTTKGERKGTVIEILSTEGMARVKTEDGKVIKLSVEKLAFDEVPGDDETEEEEEEEAAAPPKKAAKTVAPVKPTKKR